MPNGRNAGRLFADCTGHHGYGESHSVVTLAGAIPKEEDQPCEVVCMHCEKHFTLEGNKIYPVGESPEEQREAFSQGVRDHMSYEVPNPDVPSWLDFDQEARRSVLKHTLIVYGSAFIIALWIAILRKRRRA